MRSTAGFTLVEIMVATGIVAMMTGLAIPSYTRYMARSRQAEAKASLASIYSRERAFAVDAQTYTGCLKQIGVRAEPNSYYAAGFDSFAVLGPGTGCGPDGTKPCKYYIWRGANFAGLPCGATDTNTGTAVLQAKTAPGFGGNPSLPGDGNLSIINDTSTAVAETAKASAVTNSTCVAVATGKVSAMTSMYDRWSIDENSNLINGDVGI